MKKYFLYGLGALMGLAMTACDDYDSPNPPAQYNPQESILKTDEVAVTSLLTDATYDLLTLNNNDQNIEVANIYCETLPSSYQFGAEAYISADGFATKVPLTTEVVPGEEANNWKIVAGADDMQGAYQKITLSPKEANIELQFNLTTVTGSQVAYVGGPSHVYGPYGLTILPMPSDMVIEENYYLVGTIDGWDVAGAVKFSHSDQNQYDDPVFTVTFEVPSTVATDGWWWKIIPQSTYEAGDWVDADYSQFGVAENGSNAPKGTLVPRLDGNDPGAGNFDQEGMWMLTINMQDLTYEFSSAIEFLYVPGDAQGWAPADAMKLSTTDFETYTGYAVVSPVGFKFTTAPDWDHINYGAGDAPGTISASGGDITGVEAGLYWFSVNIPALTYEGTLITTIGVIGDATPGGWDASTALTTTDNIVWTGDVHFSGTGEFKFRANNGWDVNLGGQYTDLVQNGPNMPTPGEGDYTVTLNLGALPYACTLVKK